VTDAPGEGLDPEQLDGLTDMDAAAFRAAAHEVVDRMADYLVGVEERAVFPSIEPGSIRPQFPAAVPEAPESIEVILDDVDRLVVPNATHWQHPGFFAYFPTTASGPGILGEMLTAALGQNAMLWRSSPVGTELEEVVVDWLRQALGLPEGFDGLLTDTASTSSLIALGAAREAVGREIDAHGLAGRADLPALRVYASVEAHSSIEKACRTLGLGADGLVRIPTDDTFAMRPDALQAAIAADRAAGRLPVAIVATVGTTSSTAIDPVDAIADIAAFEGLWLHVDAAYAGAIAIVPSRRAPFAGWVRADSVLVNPHKWLFTPLDASLLLTRRMPDLRAAFSLVPEYLRTLDRDAPVRDYNEYQPQLGRRFRALKLWIQLRWFGLDGLRRRIEHHIELAQEFSGWIDGAPDWTRVAPMPFSTVCFRWDPGGLDVEKLDRRNVAIIDAVNRSGDVFLSHTRLRERFVIRLSVGNIRTERRHLERAWELLRDAAAAVDAESA
jgi:aromatic-L-amino-acid/L-tryptophan decarboxylase